ncbi:putative Bro-N domain-containing protein [Yalta virus]|nr:putative Bro-N domain-containing protein [Yalta virus]QKE44621.1 putative Bro-N domain-containing protein [Yalta virus]
MSSDYQTTTDVHQTSLNQPDENQPDENQPDENQPDVNQPDVNQLDVNQLDVNNLSFHSLPSSNFSFNNIKINIILDNKNEPWFKAKDIALILAYENTLQAVSRNVDEEDKMDLNNISNTSISHNYITSNDIVSNDLTSNDMTSNDMTSNDMTLSKDMTSNDMTSNDITSNDLTLSKDIISNDLTLSNDDTYILYKDNYFDNDITLSHNDIALSHIDTSLSYNDKTSIYINESGLYSLIINSNKEEVKSFKRWITKEVLPSIRKQGEYKLKNHLDKISNLSLKLKQLTIQKKIEPLKKDQYIYIASTNLYSKQNYYKVGGSKTKIVVNNSRLSVYNTGRPDEDNYSYFYVKECNNYKIIEDKINNYLKNFKPNDKKEMYNILFEDLQMLIDKIIDNDNLEIDYVNNLLSKLYGNLIDNDLGSNMFRNKSEDKKNVNDYLPLVKDKSNDDKSNDEKPNDDKSNDEKPNDDKSNDGKSSVNDYLPLVKDKSYDGKSYDDKSYDGKSIDGKSNDGISIDDKSIDDKSIDGRSNDDKSNDGKQPIPKSFKIKPIEFEEDRIIKFVKDNTIVSSKKRINKKTLYEMYCDEMQCKDINYREFNKVIRNNFSFKEKHSHCIYYWIGIRLKNF